MDAPDLSPASEAVISVTVKRFDDLCWAKWSPSTPAQRIVLIAHFQGVGPACNLGRGSPRRSGLFPGAKITHRPGHLVQLMGVSEDVAEGRLPGVNVINAALDFCSCPSVN